MQRLSQRADLRDDKCAACLRRTGRLSQVSATPAAVGAAFGAGAWVAEEADGEGAAPGLQAAMRGSASPAVKRVRKRAPSLVIRLVQFLRWYCKRAYHALLRKYGNCPEHLLPDRSLARRAPGQH